MSKPKKHHYLPQFYLKGFRCDENDKEAKIKVIPKRKRPFYTYISAIKDTGCETDYHTIDLDGLEKDRATIESNLSKVEGLHNNLIDKIIVEKKILENDKNELVKFLVLMRMRVPANKKSIEDLLKASVQSTFNILDKSGKLPSKPKIIQDAIDKGINPIKIEIYNWKLIQTIYENAQDENILNVHSQLNVALCEIQDDNEFFITSDTPVSIYYPNYKGPYGVPILDDDTELFLPINEKFGLLFNKGLQKTHISLNKAQINEFNRRTIIMADRYIYLPELNNEIKKIVKNNWNKNAGSTLDVIEHDEGSFMIGRIIPVTD